jgi:hypothetical protein
LLQIAEMIRSGEDVEIIDNATKEDKTDVTLALIISEELRNKPRAIPLSTLKALIRHRGERMLSQLRESPIGKLMPTGKEGTEGEAMAPPSGELREDDEMLTGKESRGFRATLEQWQATVDERVRAVLPNFRELEQQVKRLSERLDALERRLEKTPGAGAGSPGSSSTE